MRILLDENIPRRLKFDFNIDDEVSTVQDMNWQGKKNGELMGLMTLIFKVTKALNGKISGQILIIS